MTTSTRKKATSDTIHDTGYAKPPANHRFEKGRSGNPKGRPRKAQSTAKPLKLTDTPSNSQFEHEIYRLLQLNENGQPMEIPASQALMRSMVATALKGNRLAQKQLYELLKAEEEKAQKKSIDTYLYYANLKKQGEAEIKRCQEKNLPLPALYPHPADIHLDPVTLDIHILGPQRPEDVVLYQTQLLWRDLAMGLSIDLNTKSKPAPGQNTDDSNDYLLLLSTTINQALPPSMQHTEAEEARAYMDWRAMSKKERKVRCGNLLQEINSTPGGVRSSVEERKKTQTLLHLLMEGFAQGLDKFIQAMEEKKKTQGK